jgi:mannitol 2-dehydrogenase
MKTKLSLDGLADLPGTVGVPGYGRESLTAGIVHFGVGNFHRAHMAVYLDELFCMGDDHDWAVIGAGVRPADEKMRGTLKAQDWLSTVVARDAKGQSARVTGAMIDFYGPESRENLLARLADPAVRIISLTITEGGYFIDTATGRFDVTHREIVADGASPGAPKTVFGIILGALMARRAAGVAPFTVLSCDNIEGNGHATKNAVAGLAGLFDADLAGWVRENVAFPNAMVDRITPATTDRERQMVAETYGILDGWPVACETFRQWVIEDEFPAGRPALEKVGVTFVKDVAPYELMKIRILNGGHAALAYPAALMDILPVDQAMADPLISAYLRKLERTEIIPVVPALSGVDLDAYFEKVAERFANPTVGDTIERLCMDGYNRQPKFILASASDRLANGQSIDGLALATAFWARYCAGTSDSGAAIGTADADVARLRSLALKARAEPGVFLQLGDVFGPLAVHRAYVAAFSSALSRIWETGTKATLAHYLRG